MTTIREELIEATSLKQKKNEDDANFAKRLSAAVDDFDDDKWKALSTEAQEYHNSVVKAKDAEDDIPAFPDEDEEPDDTADGTDAETDETSEEPSDGDEDTGDEDEDKGVKKMAEKKTAKVAAKGKVKAAEKEKPAKATKAAAKPEKKAASKGNGEHKVSMCRRLKQILIKKPTLGVDDLIEKLTNEGYKPSKLTVGTIRSDTRDTMKLLKASGLLELDLG